MPTATLEAPLTFTRTPPVQREDAAPLKTLCSNCHLKELCLPCGMTGADVDRLDGLSFGRRRVKAGQALYHEGERFQFFGPLPR